MKKILLFAFLAFPVFSFAQGNDHHDRRGGEYNNGQNDYVNQAGSAVTIYSENGERFSVLLNGMKQNMYPQSRIRIENLPDVYNDIEIIFEDANTRAIHKRIAFIDPVDGKSINLTLRIERSRDGDAHLRLQKETPLEPDYRRDAHEYWMSYGKDAPQQVMPKTPQTPPPPPPPAAPTGPVAMDENSFRDAYNTIKNNNFDDSKLSTAKTIGNSNYFTTDQVMSICNLFSFEDNKLAFAEFAYSRTVDKGSYFKVGNVFHFDSNKQALNEFISGGGR